MRDVTSEIDFGKNLVWELEIARFVWLEQAKKGSLRLVHKYDRSKSQMQTTIVMDKPSQI
jgi:hypothetical protein